MNWRNIIAMALVVSACSPQVEAGVSEDEVTDKLTAESEAPAWEFLAVSSASEIQAPREALGEFLSSSGDTLEYVVYYPMNYTEDIAWPAILFLHGSDANGSDIALVRERSIQAWLPENANFPFLIISPQLARGNWDREFEILDEFWAETKLQFRILDGGQYISGYSIGATGSWQFAMRNVGEFAGLVPVAGASTFSRLAPVDEDICLLEDTPVWIFHGDADSAVPLESNIANQQALIACGNENTVLTVYEGATHGQTWPLAYAEEELVAWMISNIRQ